MLIALTSQVGYLAVHLLGVSMGTIILPPSPSYFRRQQTQLTRSHAPRTHADSDSDSDTETTTSAREKTRVLAREDDKTAMELFSYAAVWWFLFYITHALGVGFDVSRRFVRWSSFAMFFPGLIACTGESAVHTLGRGIQHVLPAWLFAVGLALLCEPPLAFDVFTHVAPEGPPRRAGSCYAPRGTCACVARGNESEWACPLPLGTCSQLSSAHVADLAIGQLSNRGH